MRNVLPVEYSCCDPAGEQRTGRRVRTHVHLLQSPDLQSPRKRAPSQHSLSGRLKRRKEGNVLFNNALNTFHLRLYGVRHMVKDHSDSERGNLLPPHGLFFPISSKGSLICIIPLTG